MHGARFSSTAISILLKKTFPYIYIYGKKDLDIEK